jgi:hypothetical protein
MEQDDCVKIFEKLFRLIHKKWDKFIKKLKEHADKDDQTLIYVDEFDALLLKFEVELAQDERERIIKAFPARTEQEGR